MSKIPTLREICRKLDCQEKTKGGICWFECNTKADKTVIIFHGVTGGKIDMMPLAERYVGFGYAVYSVDLPGHGGSVRPELNSYDDLSDWLMRVFGEIGRMPDLIISNSFASSIVYHALRTGKIPQKTKVILACPTPDPSNLADVLQKLSNRLPDRFGWNSYNSKVAQDIRTRVLLQTKKKEAWQWLRESESYKKSTLSLRDANILSTLLYEQNPYKKGVDEKMQERITVLMGGKDNVVTKQTPDIMHQLLPEARFIAAPKAGHILHFEAVENYPET